MQYKTSSRLSRIGSRTIVFLLLTTFLVNTSLAAPESARVVVASAVEFGLNRSRDLGRLDTNSYLQIPSAFLALISGKSKTKKAQARIDRIAIRPGDLTVRQGEQVSFAATAFNGAQPVGGVVFEWTMTDIDSGILALQARGSERDSITLRRRFWQSNRSDAGSSAACPFDQKNGEDKPWSRLPSENKICRSCSCLPPHTQNYRSRPLADR